ncbi:dihydrofolate reductase family protein [Streptomyces sp. NPDC046909]|uniref:dihydrofolate reductase family protein n=1 Tax=Streptomyces sp. NPDC046909 TaxID=3155617 RepID=UPI0033CBC582
MRKLTYFVACSIDGFIGDESGDASFMYPFVDEEFLEFLKAEYPETIAAHGRRALGVHHLENKRFDTVIQGRGSYEVGLKEGHTSPYSQLREYVASRSLTESPDPHVEIIADDLLGKVRELKAEEGDLGIYLCGGSQLAGELFGEIDELVIKTYPVTIGRGMPMFGSGFSITEFGLDEFRLFKNGVFVRTYSRKP